MLLLMVSVFLFSSCQKEEDKIIGTWTADLVKSTQEGTPIHYLTDVVLMQVSFFENGTYSEYIIDEEGRTDSYFGTYLISGNLLFLDGDDPFTIEELTRKKLIFSKKHVHWECVKVK